MPFTKLRSIGFSESDIEVYKLLLKFGEISWEDLLKKSGSSKDKIEESISRLLANGAIEVTGNTVSPVAPKVFLQKYLRRREYEKELQLADLRNAISQIQQGLEPIYAERMLGIKLEDLWEVIDGLPEMEIETVKMISRAKNEVCILAEQFHWYDKVREELISVIDRNVKIKVLLLVSEEKERIDEMKRYGIEIRHAECDWRSTRFTIVDNNELVFLIWAKKSGDSRIFYRPGYTTNPGLVSIFRDSFELLWGKAKPL